MLTVAVEAPRQDDLLELMRQGDEFTLGLYPPESSHLLGVEELERPEVTVFAARDDGTAIVVVSTELDEVLGLADRIAVMYRGRIIGELPAGASAQEVGLLMAGSTSQTAATAGTGRSGSGDE